MPRSLLTPSTKCSSAPLVACDINRGTFPSAITSLPLFCSSLYPSTDSCATAYLCVLQQRAADGEEHWYVQPGGQDTKTEWRKEGGRVVWKVPAECLFHKVGSVMFGLDHKLAAFRASANGSSPAFPLVCIRTNANSSFTALPLVCTCTHMRPRCPVMKVFWPDEIFHMRYAHKRIALISGQPSTPL